MTNQGSNCLIEDLERKEASTSTLTSEATVDKSETEVLNVGSALGAGSPQKAKTFDDTDSSAVSTVSIGEMCKICHCTGEANVSLIAPCYCSGSLKYVHQECLQRWIKSSDIKRCELCKYPFAMQAKVKPFCQWEKLDMTALERRKLLCSVTFHVVAITCVVWSLYVLIDRTAEEIRNGELQWPFWTKLVVVAIGFTGGLVFMYIQCKVYIHLCRKWKAYNRIIVVQDAPEGIHKPSEGQFNKLNNSVTAEPSPSRRSSSAPTTTRDGATANVGQNTTEKTNAETQTAIRGVALMESGCGHAPSGSVRDMTEEALFFTECENCKQSKISAKRAGSQNGHSSNASNNGVKQKNLRGKHFSSTPNVASAVRTSRKETLPNTKRNQTRPVRKYSLSPTRQTELPGSPDNLDEKPDRKKAKRSNTVVSPIHRKV